MELYPYVHTEFLDKNYENGHVIYNERKSK